jgi:hypothetical protein
MTAVLNVNDLLRYKLDGCKLICLQSVICFLIKSPAVAPLSATDGRVGALLFRGKYFITSPNQDFIPTPPLGNSRKVTIRADGLYGDDDSICWPQPYFPYFCHHGAIPLRNSLPAHSIMWWEPTRDQFAPLNDPTALIRGLGKLSEGKLQELKRSASVLFSRVQSYTSSPSLSRALPTLGPMVKMVEHGLVRLESVWTNFRQMSFGVRDVQRCWLDVMAMLDYMEVYKPRMDSARLAVNSAPEKVANTVGVFTYDVRVAQDFFHAGLPCWLIRPALDFGETNILHVAPLLPPGDHLILMPNSFSYPIVFEGPANSFYKYDAILRFARNFLRYPDPFNLPTTENNQSQAGPSVVSHTLAGGPNRASNPGPSRRRDTNPSRANKDNRKVPYKHWGSVSGQ